MITLLWVLATVAAFVVFMILPTIYVKSRYQPHVRQYYYLQYICGGHVFYWNNIDEDWSPFNHEASLFRSKSLARQAIGFAEAHQPEAHQLFEVEIKHCTQLV